MRIPYGLDRLPRTIALDDTRLRCVDVSNTPLRLNTEPVPPDAMPLAIGDHAARVAAAQAWLESLCGDYAPLQRYFIGAYFTWIAACIERHRDELVARLTPYDQLYAPDDYFWSALRPLPRGWVPAGDRLLPADMVFWDGTRPFVIELAARDNDRVAALRAAGIQVDRMEPNALNLPAAFDQFWQVTSLPASPFRRPIPCGVIKEDEA